MKDKTVFVNYDLMNKNEQSNYGESNSMYSQNAGTEVHNVDNIYMKLGEVYYTTAYEAPLPQLLPFFDKITLMKSLITYKEAEERKNNTLLNCLYAEIRSEYKELGRAYYIGKFEAPLPELQVFFNKLNHVNKVDHMKQNSLNKSENEPPKMSYCTKCGNKLENGAMFCTKCGTRLK